MSIFVRYFLDIHTSECYPKSPPEKDPGRLLLLFIYPGGIFGFQTVTLCCKQPLTVLNTGISLFLTPQALFEAFGNSIYLFPYVFVPTNRPRIYGPGKG